MDDDLDDAYCPHCGEWIEAKMDWDTLGEEVVCSSCGKTSTVSYEEYYDSDSGDEWGGFQLEMTK